MGEKWCGRRESNPTHFDYQAFGVQCSSFLSGARDVAGDAQIDAALAAIGVLRVADREAAIDAHVKASECGRLRFSLGELVAAGVASVSSDRMPPWCDGCGHLVVECECAAGAGVSDLTKTGERQIQDGRDRGSPSCSSPQGACLDGSGGRGVPLMIGASGVIAALAGLDQFDSLKWRGCDRCGGRSEPDAGCCEHCGREFEGGTA